MRYRGSFYASMAVLNFLADRFPEGPPAEADMDVIEAQIAEHTGSRGPPEMIAIEKALKERGEKP